MRKFDVIIAKQKTAMNPKLVGLLMNGEESLCVQHTADENTESMIFEFR